MYALLLMAGIAGQASPVPVSGTTALDGVWTVVALEINGRPTALEPDKQGLTIRNNTLTLPSIAAMHGVLRLELDPRGTLRAFPAGAAGSRRDAAESPAGSGVVGGANGVYVRTADHLAVTIGDPSTATATGAGTGSAQPANADPAGERVATTVGQPPVSLILRRSTGVDAPPSTAAAPPPPAPSDTQPAIQPESPLRRMSTVIGSDVKLSDGSSAGSITDFAYAPNGSIDYGILGNGGTFSAVPWNAFSWNANGLATLPLTRTQFGTIPTFGANEWSNLLANRPFKLQLQNTFVNFRDANGQPVFNLGMNARNQTGIQTGNQNAIQRGGQPGVQPGAQPGGQPGNQPGARPNAPPAGQPKGQPKGPPPPNNKPPGGQ